MLKSFEGICRQGKIELLETLPLDYEGRVLVTLLDDSSVNLAERGIDQRQAADLRSG